MEDLKRLSNEELAAMLRACGIIHGPVVVSTRRLYEKKLQDSLRPGHRSQATGHRSPAGITDSPSEEEEEEEEEEEGQDDGYSGKVYSTFSSPAQPPVRHRWDGKPRRAEPHRAEPQSEPIGGVGPSDRLVPVWLQLLLFALVSGLLFYVYRWMESDQESRVRSIDTDSV